MNETRSARGEAGFILRGLIRVIINPVLSVCAIGILLLTVALIPRTGEIILLGSILWPALLLGVLLLSLPSIGAAVRSFRLDESIRRNHALEHGTIYFLRKQYGKRFKLSGSSEARGFRVAGARTPRDIERAFKELMQNWRSGNRSIVVARGCGSNVATAQAIGLVLLASLTLSFLFLSPRPVAVLISVVAVICVVALVRYPIGMRIQARRFLLLDFEDAIIESVYPLKKARIFERHPVYFVKTRVQTELKTVPPPNRPLNPSGASSAPAG